MAYFKFGEVPQMAESPVEKSVHEVQTDTLLEIINGPAENVPFGLFSDLHLIHEHVIVSAEGYVNRGTQTNDFEKQYPVQTIVFPDTDGKPVKCCESCHANPCISLMSAFAKRIGAPIENGKVRLITFLGHNDVEVMKNIQEYSARQERLDNYLPTKPPLEGIPHEITWVELTATIALYSSVTEYNST